jgi:nitrogen fixation protein NifU and related proteins
VLQEYNNDMSELHELYQALILDHGRNPRHFGVLSTANRTAEGFNPLCGDKIKVYLEIHPDRHQLKSIQFDGVGCAISIASASMMTEALQGKTIAVVQELFELFHKLLTAPPSQKAAAIDKLGKLNVLSGVRAFPSRVKCATLAWHTLQMALSQSRKTATMKQ